MKTQVVQVLLRRSETSNVQDVVFAHEIPVLKIARGHGNVEVTDADTSQYDLKPFELRDPRRELMRLKAKYKGFVVDGQHPVDIAFPDGSRDIELFYKDPSQFDQVGEELDIEDPFDEDSSVMKVPVDEAEEPGPVDQLDADQDVDPFAEDVDPVTGVNPKDRPAVLEALNAQAIPFAKTVGTAKLHTLLKATLEEGAKTPPAEQVV